MVFAERGLMITQNRIVLEYFRKPFFGRFGLKKDVSVFFWQIFGAYATHPFKFSDHYYGTGETFLYTFSPNFKVPKWEKYPLYYNRNAHCCIVRIMGVGVEQQLSHNLIWTHARLSLFFMAIAHRLLLGSLLGPCKLLFHVFWDLGRDDSRSEPTCAWRGLSYFITPLKISSWYRKGLAIWSFLIQGLVSFHTDVLSQ